MSSAEYSCKLLNAIFCIPANSVDPDQTAVHCPFIHSVISNNFVSGQWRPWATRGRGGGGRRGRGGNFYDPTYSYILQISKYIPNSYTLYLFENKITLFIYFNKDLMTTYISVLGVKTINWASLSGSVGLVIRRLWVRPRLGRQHSFMEIDHEIFSMVILSLSLFQEGHLSVSGKRMCTILVIHLED